MIKPRNDLATERQVQAADPVHSTWLSANAGSGKTRVLTDRVARLLLAEVEPQSILCLTYTKAAAAEMQNRLFKRLGDWAMMPDAHLIEQMQKLGVEQSVSDDFLSRARRLFARAIETPGGLKIQTIHSFCAMLLRRFPLEAGVSPAFTEMDEIASKALSLQVLDTLALSQPDLFEACAAHVSDSDMMKLADEIARHGDAFHASVGWDEIAQIVGLPAELDEAALAARVFLGTEQSLIKELIPVFKNGSITDQRAADKLGQLGDLGFDALPALEDIFLNKSGANAFGAKIGKLPTKGTQSRIPDLMEPLNALMSRVEWAREPRLALAAARKTQTLFDFARAYLPLYQSRKSALGVLDFDDLIVKARDLLTRPGLAEWVLFKLDGGIDHVLVDEAQDTSPLQWQVIRLLTQDFASGESARSDTPRSIFVVGDKKQSIYSFQGADPEGFDHMRNDFAERLQQARQGLVQLQLEHSFRSSQAILQMVDMLFRDNNAGLGTVEHIAFKGDMPGRVDVWPLIEPEGSEDNDNWENPLDLIGETHPHRRLARQIAREIRQMIHRDVLWDIGADGELVPRPITEGDVLILVQRRSQLFHEIIRACKEASLEVAGADRLKLSGELAVRDIVAVLSFLATPEDDLSLAAALRSPLFDWSEKELFKLAAKREERFLWRALQGQKEHYAETVSILEALRNAADFRRPYDLIAQLLLRHDGRRKLVARLGAEAEDGIDAVLLQALKYEQTEPPSLTGFLSWMEKGDTDIKRQPDSAGRKLRVMTVHGAKGLEAPIVILPDTTDRQNTIRSDLLKGPDGAVVWKMPSAAMPLALSAIAEHMKDQQTLERQRLLYVAMTRAEKWLIVCAAGKVTEAKGSWFDQVSQTMGVLETHRLSFPEGEGLRYQPLAWPHADIKAQTDTSGQDHPLPDWAHVTPPTPERPLQPISPSDLGGAKTVPGDGEDSEAAKKRGTMIHLLLEHLPGTPSDARAESAKAIFNLSEEQTDSALFETVLAEASGVLDAPHLAHLFTADTLAEVQITATFPGTDRQMLGTIDRLIIGPDHVLLVDFKSNVTAPQSPDQTPIGLLRQMAAYAQAVAQIYPDKRIETAILWTRTASLMPLPDALIMGALQNMSIP